MSRAGRPKIAQLALVRGPARAGPNYDGMAGSQHGGEAIDAALAVARSAPDDIVDAIAGGRRIVVTGAGSSYYVAQVAASTMRQVGHLPAVAVPLSDVLLRPGDVFAPGSAVDQPVIVVSRSGSTTEAVDSARVVRERHGYALAVTCRPGSPMAAIASDALAIPEANEESIVMTRSFAAMVTLLMRLGARRAIPSSGEPSTSYRVGGARRPLTWTGPSSSPLRGHPGSWSSGAAPPTAWRTRPC